ncbi:MAG: DUF6318 family protein [Nocardioides sp.]|jgi:nitrous oxide reductase accessory protein NosL
MDTLGVGFSGKQVFALRMVRTVVVLVVSLIGLAACGGEDPTADPTPIQASSSSVSSPTASESESAEPEVELWQQKSRAGAKAFVDHWLEALDVAQTTGDLGPLRASSHRRCVGCTGYVKAVGRLYAAGGHIKTGPWLAAHKAYDRQQSPSSPRIVVDVRIPKAVQVLSSGAEPETFPAGRDTFAAWLRWVNDQWVMWEWEFLR